MRDSNALMVAFRARRRRGVDQGRAIDNRIE
jgi:hypothetical protein